MFLSLLDSKRQRNIEKSIWWISVFYRLTDTDIFGRNLSKYDDSYIHSYYVTYVICDTVDDLYYFMLATLVLAS